MAGPQFAERLRTAPEQDDSNPIAPPRVGRWLVLAAGVGLASTLLGSAAPPVRATTATFDLERDLPRAQVAVQRGNAPTACRWVSEDERFACLDEPWAFIGAYGAYSAGRPRRCTWIHPVASGAPTVLTFAKQAVGRTIAASIGLVDGAPSGSPVTLRVTAGADVLASLTSADSRELQQIETDVPAGVAVADVRVQVSVPDHALRMACIDVRMFGTRLAPEAVDASIGAKPAPVPPPAPATAGSR